MSAEEQLLVANGRSNVLQREIDETKSTIRDLEGDVTEISQTVDSISLSAGGNTIQDPVTVYGDGSAY